MPAGLDGHLSPIRTVDRDAVLRSVADRVCSVERRRVLVGIDGRSGSGKSTFADELAAHLGERGRVVIRSTTDSFHRPRVERLARGTTSADGYYLDSHDLDRIATELLIPFRDAEWWQYLLADLPDDVSQRAVELDRRLDTARWPRYRHGWARYVGDVAPRSRATVVVDNNHLAQPRILEAT